MSPYCSYSTHCGIVRSSHDAIRMFAASMILYAARRCIHRRLNTSLAVNWAAETLRMYPNCPRIPEIIRIINTVGHTAKFGSIRTGCIPTSTDTTRTSGVTRAMRTGNARFAPTREG